MTTLFVGSHFHVENGVIVKYYFDGAQRIAMRKNGTLSYILTDHLGSTSMTTNASGAMISEVKYKAWGETRYSSGSTPTNYKYTGQREEAGFGLYFYNARWYDPLTGRFAQADTVITGESHKGAQTLSDVASAMFTPLTVSYSEQPILMKQNADSAFIQQHGVSLANVSDKEKKKAKIVGVPLDIQALDRYAYVRNSPMKYMDPTGHDAEGPLAVFMVLLRMDADRLYRNAKNEALVGGIFIGVGLAIGAGIVCYGSIGTACIVAGGVAVGLEYLAVDIIYQNNGGAQADAYTDLANDIGFYISMGNYDGGSNFTYSFTLDSNKKGWGTFTIRDANGRFVADAYVKEKWLKDILAISQTAIFNWELRHSEDK